MKVQILKSTKKLNGEVGDIVECDPAIGNPLACVGVVKVIDHDKPSAKSKTAKIVNDENAKKLQKDGE